MSPWAEVRWSSLAFEHRGHHIEIRAPRRADHPTVVELLIRLPKTHQLALLKNMKAEADAADADFVITAEDLLVIVEAYEAGATA
jgi:hypothetical protein